MGSLTHASGNGDQGLIKLDGFAVLNVNGSHRASTIGFDLIHHLHGLDNAEHITHAHGLAYLDERRRFGAGRAV